jgi:hypothetical protein
MAYNFHENFKETPNYCFECLHAIAVAALLQYRLDVEASDDEKIKVKVYLAQKTVEVCGKEIRIYLWRELGFTKVC